MQLIKIILSSSNTESDDMKQYGNLKGKDRYSENFFRNMNWLIKQLQDIIINSKEPELKTLISYVATRLDENKIGSEYSIRLIMLMSSQELIPNHSQFLHCFLFTDLKFFFGALISSLYKNERCLNDNKYFIILKYAKKYGSNVLKEALRISLEFSQNSAVDVNFEQHILQMNLQVESFYY